MPEGCPAYRPRKPHLTPHYQCLQDHFETLEQVRAAAIFCWGTYQTGIIPICMCSQGSFRPIFFMTGT